MLYYIKHEIIGEYVQQIKDGVVVRYFFRYIFSTCYIILFLIQFVDVSWNIIHIFTIVYYLNFIRKKNKRNKHQLIQPEIIICLIQQQNIQNMLCFAYDDQKHSQNFDASI